MGCKWQEDMMSEQNKSLLKSRHWME